MLADFISSLPKDIVESASKMDLNISSNNANVAINDLLQRTVLVGGKRLRPLLTFLMGDLFGVAPSELMTYARSIELVHAASLSHDDVIDQATTRRGVPSINVAGSNKRAVLAGDYLLAQVIQDLAQQGNLYLVQEMSKVIQDLALGEWLQWDASEERKYSREIILEIARNKTASVMSWCGVAAATMAESTDDERESARRFGEFLGYAFQLMDDTLDFSGSSNKDTLLDMKNGIVNSVLYEWLELNSEAHEKFKSGSDLSELFGDNELDKAIEAVKDRAIHYLEEAKRELDFIQQSLTARGHEPARVAKSREYLDLIMAFLAMRDV
jgi:geranylgeranyl pyrophosphate synthase